MLISFPGSIWKAIFILILLFPFFFSWLLSFYSAWVLCFENSAKGFPHSLHSPLTALQKNKTHIYTFNLAPQRSLKVLPFHIKFLLEKNNLIINPEIQFCMFLHQAKTTEFTTTENTKVKWMKLIYPGFFFPLQSLLGHCIRRTYSHFTVFVKLEAIMKWYRNYLAQSGIKNINLG